MTTNIDSLNYIFDFGKYKDKSLQRIMFEDPIYLNWLNKTGICCFTAEIERMITKLCFGGYSDHCYDQGEL